MSLDGHLDTAVGRGGVEFAFTVQNGGTEPVELSFRSGPIADIAVYEDGEEVWRFSDGRLFTQALETEMLAPGETFTHAGTWDDPTPGEYVAVATLEATNVEVEARTEFEV